MSELAVEIASDPKVTVVRLVGSAGIEGAAELDRKLTALSALRPRYLVFDLAGLIFISSLAIGSLMGIVRGVSRHGGKTAAAAAQPKVADVLKQVRVETVMPVYATLDEAIAAA